MLASADGKSVTAVAAELGVSRDTVRKWRGRFTVSRLEGLSDEPRPGAPRKISDEQVELVISKTLEERGPGEDTHWSTRSMAAATGMSQSAVSRIWGAFGLKPHLVQTCKLSADPQFIERPAMSWACTWILRRRPWSWRLMSWVGPGRVDVLADVTFLPPAEPDVRVSTHPALHESMSVSYLARHGVWLAQGAGMLAARYR